MQLNKLDSAFLKYIIAKDLSPGDRLPTLSEIGAELGISVGKLREQLELARSLGVVSVRPRVGIQREPFDFSRVLLDGVLFGMAIGEARFEQLSQMRQVVEAGFWDAAVTQLMPEDKCTLRELVDKAWGKLRTQPIHIPNGEHRALHLTIYRRLDNPFVRGLLETYWDAYEAVELTRFMSYEYWLEVWNYHEQIVSALEESDFARGKQLLVEHFSLLRPFPTDGALSSATAPKPSTERV